MKKTVLLLLPILLVVTLSCVPSKEVLYLQNAADYGKQTVAAPSLTVQPNDLLDIVVTCANPELAVPFNDYAINITAMGAYSGSAARQHYAVNDDGDIIFPILGSLHVQGLTTREVSDMIASIIKEKDYIKDPAVSTKITNFRISIMGAVKLPGVYDIPKQGITILEALSKAGDMDIQGKRYNITVVREVNGTREVGYVDIRDKAIFSSPYYYLQQNDVIYVEPTKAKINSGSDRQIAILSAQITTVLISVASLVVTILK